MVKIDPPYAALLELTHACPLRCAYCSNPLALATRESELTTNQWLKVIQQSADAGVLQIHFSGGEPLLRDDLALLVKASAQAGVYTNLITSGIGLTELRLNQLKECGLNSVQVSVQDVEETGFREITGGDFRSAKKLACAVVKKADLPLSVNVVLHKVNIDRVDELIELGISYGANRIELANTQFYGWGFKNRQALIPSAEQMKNAFAAYTKFKESLSKSSTKLELIWVLSDYYEKFPKPCMNGWGKSTLTVAPNGSVYPCPAASIIDTLKFDNVREKDIAWIWFESKSFNAFRGTDWMKEPCRSCERQEIDFGGCRCQAFLLTNDASNADPVCHLSLANKDIQLFLDGLPESTTLELRNIVTK